MTQTELAWYSALNYFTPIIYNGIKRGDRAAGQYLRMPKVKLALGQRTPMKPEEADNLMDLLRQMCPHYFNDKEIFDLIKDMPIMFRKNGTKYSRFTILGYVQKVRKEPGMRPDDINSQLYQIKVLHSQGKTLEQIIEITGSRKDYCKKIIAKLVK